MKPTDTSEKGLESIIVASLVEDAGYVQGDPQDYDREHAVDLAKLLQFLAATQPDTYEALGIDEEGPKRTQFLHRLQGEIATADPGRIFCPALPQLRRVAVTGREGRRGGVTRWKDLPALGEEVPDVQLLRPAVSAATRSAPPPLRRLPSVPLSAWRPPTVRIVLVNGFDAAVHSGDAVRPVSSQRYSPDVVAPDGSSRLESFAAEPWPTWTRLSTLTPLARWVWPTRARSMQALA